MTIRFVLGPPLVASVLLTGCGQDAGTPPAAAPPPAVEKNTSIKSLPVEPRAGGAPASAP